MHTPLYPRAHEYQIKEATLALRGPHSTKRSRADQKSRGEQLTAENMPRFFCTWARMHASVVAMDMAIEMEVERKRKKEIGKSGQE